MAMKKKPAARKRIAPRETRPVHAVGADALINTQLSRAFYLYLNWLGQGLDETGLSKHLKPGMGPILFTLFDVDDVMAKDLVERTQLDPSTITRTLQKMEEAGLVGRSKDDRDGRAIRISLTPLGRSLEPACRKIDH